MVISIAPVFATDVETPTLVASSESVYRGGIATVRITLDKPETISGIQFFISYDKNKFDIANEEEITLNPALDELFIEKTLDTNKGIIKLVGSKTSNTGITTPIDVVNIKMKAKSDAPYGKSDLILSDYYLNRIYVDGTTKTAVEIIPQITNGSITVRTSGGGGSSPTPTPPPTVSPSPSPSPSASPSPTPQASEEPVSSSGFVDVGKDVEWAEEAITELAKAGIVSGSVSSDTGEKVFEPNNKITRAEFAKLIVGAFNLPEATDDANYSDVNKDDWFFKTIATASKLGIVMGYEGGIFNPNKEITREEMCVMLIRAAKAIGLNIPEAELSFDDSSSVSDFAISSIAGLAKLGIINGVGDNNFAPLNNATRAESAKVIYQIYKMLKALQ